MGLYVKKPVQIEAIRFEGNNPEDVQACGTNLANWCGGKFFFATQDAEESYILIKTLEGEMRADFGDFIIKGVQGEFYPCKPDIFELSYDEVVE